jgi:hypothetical protein
MTAANYTRIVALLAKAEEVLIDAPAKTPKGKEIEAEIRALLAKIEAERIRAEVREEQLGAAGRDH